MEKKNDGFAFSGTLVVEKIIGFFITKDNRKYYQIQFAPVWENSENLKGCEKLIERYFNQNGLSTIKESYVVDEAVSDVDKHGEDNVENEIDIFAENSEINTEEIPVQDENIQDCIPKVTNQPFSSNIHPPDQIESLNNSSFPGNNLEHSRYSNSPSMTKLLPATRNNNNADIGGPILPDVDSKDILTPIHHQLSRVENINPSVRMYVRTNDNSSDNDSSETQKATSNPHHSYTCNECHISFQTNIDLKLHQNVHINQAAEYSYATQYNNEHNSIYEPVEVHAKLHTNDRPFKCNECNKTFPRSFDLKRHKYHHKRAYIFECTICNRKFKYSQQLMVHTRIHTGERPFKCNLCEKTFYCKGNLTCHKQTHTREKPFKCKQCDKMFKLKGNLRRHEKQH